MKLEKLWLKMLKMKVSKPLCNTWRSIGTIHFDQP